MSEEENRLASHGCYQIVVWLAVVLDVGDQMVWAAFRDDASGLALILAALGGHTQLHLKVIKVQTRARATFNRFVIDATANANNHDAFNL